MGPFRWATVSAVKIAFPPFWNWRELTICIGEWNGTVASKQAISNGLLQIYYKTYSQHTLQELNTFTQYTTKHPLPNDQDIRSFGEQEISAPSHVI